jgi:hypothetical protein
MRHHCAAQGLTVNHPFYLGAVRRLLDALRRNDQEMADCCMANLCVPVHLVQLVQPIRLHSQCSMPVFTVSYLKHTLRGETFEDE